MRTLFDPSMHLKKNRGSSVSQVEYAKIIGSMMFLMNYTRSNIRHICIRHGAVNTIAEAWYYLLGVCEI